MIYDKHEQTLLRAAHSFRGQDGIEWKLRFAVALVGIGCAAGVASKPDAIESWAFGAMCFSAFLTSCELVILRARALRLIQKLGASPDSDLASFAPQR